MTEPIFTEETQPVVPPTQAPVMPIEFKCIKCEKSSNNGILLINKPNHIWEFDGEAMCIECYIRHMVENAIEEGLDWRRKTNAEKAELIDESNHPFVPMS